MHMSLTRSCRIGTLVFSFLALFASSALCANIIVDHTNWNWYDNQSSSVVNNVSGVKIYFAHASVGSNIMNGFSSLHTADAAKYPLNQVSAGATPPETTPPGTIYHYARGNPGWEAKVTDFATYIGNGWHATSVHIVMNKFCYIDQAADWATYRDSMLALEAAYPTTKFVYWTMPLMTSGGSSGALRAQFNQNLRDWIATQDNKILFDIADIEAWSPEGVHQMFTYNEQTYEMLYSGYTDDGGHLNATGAARMATGLYSLFGLFAAGGNILYANFTGSGIWKWNTIQWTQTTTSNPQMLVTVGSDLYGTFPGLGIWKFNGTGWTKTTNSIPQMIVGTATTLYGTFEGMGIWKWDGSGWAQATTSNPQLIVASDTKLYGTFAGQGIWQLNGETWTLVTPNVPELLVSSGSLLYATFPGSGVWKYENAGWSQVTANMPQMMVAAGANLYCAYSGLGIWAWNGSAWTQISPNNPQQMTVSGSDLYAAFAGAGISKWNGSTWMQISPDNPVNMVAGYAGPQTAGVNKFKLEYNFGSYTGTYSNIYAIWAENSAENFYYPIYICNRLLGIGGGLAGTALPYWKVNKYPLMDSSEIDAVTGATEKKKDFTVSFTLPQRTPRQFTLYFETDVYYNANDWFANQPATLYKVDIDLDHFQPEYLMSFIGWTPDEIVVSSETTNNYISSIELVRGGLQTETRYIAHLKVSSSPDVFGGADDNPQTNLVESIRITPDN